MHISPFAGVYPLSTFFSYLFIISLLLEVSPLQIHFTYSVATTAALDRTLTYRAALTRIRGQGEISVTVKTLG